MAFSNCGRFWPWEHHEPGPPNEPGPLASPDKPLPKDTNRNSHPFAKTTPSKNYPLVSAPILGILLMGGTLMGERFLCAFCATVRCRLPSVKRHLTVTQMLRSFGPASTWQVLSRLVVGAVFVRPVPSLSLAPSMLAVFVFLAFLCRLSRELAMEPVAVWPLRFSCPRGAAEI